MSSSSKLVLDTCVVDLVVREVRRENETVRLTPKEASLLAYLAERPTMVISREVLLVEVWAYAPGVRSRAPDLAVHSLRKKVEADPRNPSHILTDYGAGWRFQPRRIAFEESVESGLFGRDALLTRLRKRVRSPGPITLVGPPGVGKTALARFFAESEAARRAVWRCDLSEATELSELLSRVCEALEIVSSEDTSTVSRVGHGLAAAGSGLLVLDDCEALGSEARAAVERWSAMTTVLTILATSRERMWWRGEHAVEVPPLEPSDAIALLRARCLAAGESDPGTDEQLEELAVELDGVPLALELASARIPFLGVSGVLSAMTERLGVLGHRTVGPRPRHRSLERAIDVSWSLLGADEHRLFAALSAFPDAFDLAGVEAVGGEGSLDALLALIDRSLVRPLGGSPARFTMLRTLRTYAAGRLEGAERERVWCAHADFAVSDAGTIPDRLASARRIDVIGPERCAHSVLRLAQLRRQAPLRPIVQALELLEPYLPRLSPELGWRVRLAWARCLLGIGDHAQAEATLGSIAVEDSQTACEVQLMRAKIYLSARRYRAARELFDSASVVAAELGDERLTMHALAGLGQVSLRMGELPRALENLAESGRVADRIGDHYGVIHASLCRAEALLDTVDEEGVLVSVREALRLEPGRRRRADAGLVMGILHLGMGRLDESITSFSRVRSELHALGEPYQVAISSHNLAHALIERGDFDWSHALLEETIHSFRESKSRPQEGISLGTLGLLQILDENPSAGVRSLSQAIAFLEPTGARGMLVALQCMRCFGRLRAGDVDGARRDVSEAGAKEFPGTLTRSLLTLAQAAVERRAPPRIELETVPIRIRSLIRVVRSL